MVVKIRQDVRKMIKKILLSALILSTPYFVSASNVSVEEDKLDRFYQAFENRTLELEDVENELFGYDYKLDRARQDLKTAEAELAAAQQEYAKIKAAVAADNSEENQRALKLIEHSMNMSERGVRTRTKRLERVEGSLSELQASKAKLDAQIAAAKTRIDAQEQTLAIAKKEQADRAHKEAQRQVASVKPQQALTVPVEPKAAVATVAAEVMEEAHTEPTAEEKAQAVSATESAELSELDKEAQEYAKNEVARLQETLSTGDMGRPTFRNLSLTGNKVEPAMFEFLGQDQYRVDVVVENGRQIFEVGRNKFRRTVPASDNGQTYVFIFDAERLSRPRLVMFKKSLVDDF